MRRNSLRGALVATALLGLTLTASAVKAQDDNLDGDAAVHANFTTQHLLVRADGTTKILDNYTELHAIGKPGGTISITTGTNHCGSYQSDGVPTYSTSGTFTGTLNEITLLALSGTNTKPIKVSTATYIVGSAPSVGKKYDTITLFQEGSYPDDGECTEGGLTYHKYTVTEAN